MCKKLVFLVSIVVLLGLAGTVSAVELKVDVGCPGQEAAGNLKAGWVAFNGTACSGATGPVTVTNIGGSGIDVAITIGNPSDNAYRSPGEYTGDEMGRDYVSADDSAAQAECTMTMTLSNLPEAGYTLTTYHNCPDQPDPKDAIDITVSGSGVVGTPTNATNVAQTVLSTNVAFGDIGKGTVQFVADGAGEVVVTFVAREGVYKWRAYLNGFELSGVGLHPAIEFESAASGAMEDVSPAIIPVTLLYPEEGQTYTVDYAATGGTATAGVDYVMGGAGPACWNSPTQCHGDTDNSGDVKGSDFLALKEAWYKCDPEPGYDACADFDRDGCVKGSDFLILKNNWYQAVEANCPSEGGPATLEFAPGETTKTISINIIDDGLAEEDETIEVTLSNPTGENVELGAITKHTYTITETVPTVSFGAESSSGIESTTPVIIPVNLSHVSGDTITVNYAVTGGTATAGSDYNLSPGTLTFDPGQTTKTLNLSIVDDSSIEETETVVITLSNPTNATLGPITQYTYSILDNEAGVVWDGLTWFYSERSGGPFVNGDGNLEWDPEKNGLFITRIPEQRLSQTGDKVEITYMWMTDGAHNCPDCFDCDLYCHDDDITCIAGTSDMRVGLFDADGEYVDRDGMGYSNSIFEGYRGYGWRFGPNMESGPTRWVDCTGEVHKTGQFDKKPSDGSSLMHVNDDILGGEINGFELPPGQYSLFTVKLQRTSSSRVSLSITLNGRTETYSDSGGDQARKIDVFAIHMRNGRPYSRLVLAKP